MSKVGSIGVVAALLLAGGCATYAPASTNSVTGGQPAAAYAVPASRPEGQVRLSAPGLTRAPDGTRAVYLRMVVTNDSARSWLVDPAQQTIGFAGGAASAPFRVTRPRGTAPVPVHPLEPIAIAPGHSQVIDLYYPLPPGTKPSQLRPFEAAWVVNAGERTIGGRTQFRRVAADALLPCGPHQRCLATSSL